jgi:enoyl-CoA hydratase/carnithine racemase
LSFETIHYEVNMGVAVITLHRPEKMNAFTNQMRLDIIAALDLVDQDDEVKAVIFTGAGKAFCAGADLSQGGKTFDYEAQQTNARLSLKRAGAYRDGGGTVTLRIYECLKPVIGAINGAAVGIGFTMQLPMDIRMASNQARFGAVFARRGIVPEAASTWFLTRAVDIQTALEWCYTGRVFDAQEALSKGLVRSLHEPQDLLPAAIALAREIADNTAPVSIALTRQMLWRNHAAEHPMQAHRVDSRGIFTRGQSDDVREGVASFLEKRPAQFPNKVSKDMPDFYPWWDEPEFR